MIFRVPNHGTGTCTREKAQNFFSFCPKILFIYLLDIHLYEYICIWVVWVCYFWISSCQNIYLISIIILCVSKGDEDSKKAPSTEATTNENKKLLFEIILLLGEKASCRRRRTPILTSLFMSFFCVHFVPDNKYTCKFDAIIFRHRQKKTKTNELG